MYYAARQQFKETCWQSDSSEKPLAKVDVKNSQRSIIIRNWKASLGYVLKEMKKVNHLMSVYRKLAQKK